MRRQLETNTGKHMRFALMSFWSMQNLSIQTLGSRSCASTKSRRQAWSASHLARGGSDQE